MEQIGFITKILPDNKCKVLVSKISGWKGTCNTCSGCPTPQAHIVMENRLGVSVGDYVKIGVDSTVVLKYSIFLYGFPLLIFIFSIVLFNVLFSNLKNVDVISFFVGIFFTFLAFVFVKFIDKKYAHLSTKSMYMQKIMSRKEIH